MDKIYSHSYAELAKIGIEYHRDDNFCSLVATCVATGKPFSKVFRAYKAQGRTLRRGTRLSVQSCILKGYGKRMTQMFKMLGTYRTLTAVAKSCHTWGKGVYWVYTNDHVAAVRDGVLEDWSATRKSKKRITLIYKIEDEA